MTDSGMKWCAYSGLVFLALFGTGLVGSGLFPPLEPSASAQEIGEFFSQNTTRVRVGLVIVMLSMGFFLPFLAAIAAQMKMMGNHSPSLIYTVLICAAILGLVLFNAVDFWAQAAYRPGRDVGDIMLLNDMAYTNLVWNPIVPVILFMAFGLATHLDTRVHPVFPRWLAYYSYWAALASLPGSLLIFFHDGPFAWDGLLGLWIPAIVLLGWLGILAYFTVKNACAGNSDEIT